MSAGDRRFVYRNLKDAAFLVRDGVRLEGSVTIATPERALLDLLYLEPDASVDSIDMLDQEACLQLAPLYQNKQLTKRLQALLNVYAQ